MAKWKLFSKSKSKKENKLECEEIVHPEPEEILEKKQETTVEIGQNSEEPAATDYRETLYSKGYEPKKGTPSTKTDEEPWKQKSWESVNTVEKNVDHFDKKKIEKKTTRPSKIPYDSDIDKKIDRLISKKK